MGGGGAACPSQSWHGDGGPLVPVRRLTERQQSQDTGWDIDRLEPEGSCRIETHCQRLCYHQRLPASEGGRGLGWGGGGGIEWEGEMERLGEKMEMPLYQNVKEEGCVGQYSDDSVCVGVRFSCI